MTGSDSGLRPPEVMAEGCLVVDDPCSDASNVAVVHAAHLDGGEMLFDGGFTTTDE